MKQKSAVVHQPHYLVSNTSVILLLYIQNWILIVNLVTKLLMVVGKEFAKKIATGVEMIPFANVSKFDLKTKFKEIFKILDVECGRVQPIWKGEIIYVNLTTHLGSVINYSCGNGYRLIGEKERICQKDGKWSGSKAKCEGNADIFIDIQNYFLFRYRNSMFATTNSEKFFRHLQWQ